jgi:hypothetical protein
MQRCAVNTCAVPPAAMRPRPGPCSACCLVLSASCFVDSCFGRPPPLHPCTPAPLHAHAQHATHLAHGDRLRDGGDEPRQALEERVLLAAVPEGDGLHEGSHLHEAVVEEPGLGHLGRGGGGGEWGDCWRRHTRARARTHTHTAEHRLAHHVRMMRTCTYAHARMAGCSPPPPPPPATHATHARRQQPTLAEFSRRAGWLLSSFW